jgi:hypothetical protein
MTYSETYPAIERPEVLRWSMCAAAVALMHVLPARSSSPIALRYLPRIGLGDAKCCETGISPRLSRRL